MPYDEVLRVRMDDNALEFVIEGDSKRQHVRMSTRSEFNLWREALYPKIANPTLHPNVMSCKSVAAGRKVSAVHAAQTWLKSAEGAEEGAAPVPTVN